MAGRVLDKNEFISPMFNYATEYDIMFNRQLWDKATRSNFFKLSTDRKRRVLRGTKHAPIHWDCSVDREYDDVESMPSIPTPSPAPRRMSPKTTSSRPVSGPRSAWGEKTSKPSTPHSEFVIIHPDEVSDGGNSAVSLKRSTAQRSPTPAYPNYAGNRKKLCVQDTPKPRGKTAERISPISRPKSAPSSRLGNVNNDRSNTQNSGSRPESRSSTSSRPDSVLSRPDTGVSHRPKTATASSRPGTAQSFYSEVSNVDQKLPPATSSQGRNSRGSQVATMKNTLKPASAPFALHGGESETAKDHDLRDFRMKNAAKGLGVAFEKVMSNNLLRKDVGMADLPHDIRLWVTEYQGNFKAFRPF